MSREGFLYKGKNAQPWGPRRMVKSVVGNVAKEMDIKRWNGAARIATEWDGLRRVSKPSLKMKISTNDNSRIQNYGFMMGIVWSI